MGVSLVDWAPPYQQDLTMVDSYPPLLLGKSLSKIFGVLLLMGAMAEGNMGAIRSVRFQKIENATFRSVSGTFEKCHILLSKSKFIMPDFAQTLSQSANI